MGCANRLVEIGVVVEIRRYVDDDQPGWVECALTDAHGREWLFVEKVPIVTAAELDAASAYPQRGTIACQVIERSHGGRAGWVVVNTAIPYGIAASTGESLFEVREEQLTAV